MKSYLVVFAIIGLLPPALRAQQVTLGPDSQVQAGVPHGTTTHYVFKNSVVYPGTERDYWVYVPKQYDGKTALPVMVFQDGGGYQDVNGSNCVPVVFDNLIAKGQMPPTVAVMVNPGVVPASRPDALPRFNRSVEYDTPDDTYARFLHDELLPEVGKTVKLTDDPNARALCGASSGGMASFVAAWFRPEWFRRVVSGIGSFVDLRGGNVLPDRIRKHEPKPLRVYLQDNENDQDIYGGSWPIANRDMAAALKYAGYDYQFVTDAGGHDGRQLGARLPDALRWLWRDYPKPITPNYTPNQPVTTLIEPGETWQTVALPNSPFMQHGLAVNSMGEVFFQTMFPEKIQKIGTDGAVKPVMDAPRFAQAFAFGPDGRLYIAMSSERRIVAYDLKKPNAKPETVAEGVDTQDFVVASSGVIYALESSSVLKQVDPRTHKAMEAPALDYNAAGLCLSPDQSLLLVTPANVNANGYSLQIAPNGSLVNKQAFFDLESRYGGTYGESSRGVTDSNGWLYVLTTAGIQICDQAGRVNGVLDAPERRLCSAIAFGGPNRDTLFVQTPGGIYRRRMRAKGVLPFEPPVKPAPPRL